MLFLPIAGLIISKISNGLRRDLKGQENLGDILSLTEETLFGLKIIKSFNAQSFINNKYQKKSNSLYNLMLGINRRIYLASPISEFWEFWQLSLIIRWKLSSKPVYSARCFYWLSDFVFSAYKSI